MEQEDREIRHFSESILGPVGKTYKAGRIGVILVLAGTMMQLGGFLFLQAPYSHAVGVGGAAIVMAIIAVVYFLYVRKLGVMNRDLKKRKEMLDAFQNTAIQMAEFTIHLQVFVVGHAQRIVSVVEKLRKGATTITSIFHHLSLIERIENRLILVEELADLLVATSDSTREALEDLRRALAQSDIGKLKKHLGLIQELDEKIRKLLSRYPIHREEKAEEEETKEPPEPVAEPAESVSPQPSTENP